MSEQPDTANLGSPDRPHAPGESIGLPPADFIGPPRNIPPELERTYFDPEGWDAEMVNRQVEDGHDPAEPGASRREGQGTAALFVSDFHAADGSAGGDDFLDSHLAPDEALGGLYAGFAPPGESRAGLFASVLAFALERTSGCAGAGARLDVVLNGDVLNGLELKGRGGTYVSGKHRLLFRSLAAVHGRADVYWLRGNHDYVVPSGVWAVGESYVNDRLQVLAEHGDFWDKENWPPGPANKGSRLALEVGAAFEVHAGVMSDGSFKYLMSGIDNLRPWSSGAIKGFLDRRSKYSDVAALGAALARLKYVGAADDSAAYRGALERRGRNGEYRDWLMVQGHTHVPAAEPGVYYNLGTWITTLVALKGKETLVEAFPFLLVYLDAAGRRVEEYYVVGRSEPGTVPRATLQSAESVNALRKAMGYKKLTT
jgi:hypothetical protein